MTADPKPRRGQPPKPDDQRLSAAIPRTRCLPVTRAQFDELGGADWLRDAIAEAWAQRQRSKRAGDGAGTAGPG